MDIETWEKEYSVKWPKRAKEIEKIGEMCLSKDYDVPKGIPGSRLKTLEFDYGLAIAWKRGSNIEVFVYLSNSYQIYDMNRKSVSDRLPRSMGTLMQQVGNVVSAQVRGADRQIRESERRLFAGGTGPTPREINFKEYMKSAKTSKKKGKKR